MLNNKLFYVFLLKLNKPEVVFFYLINYKIKNLFIMRNLEKILK